LADLKVKVIIRRSTTRTREIPEIYEGVASRTLIKDANLGVYSDNPWTRLAIRAVEARLTSWEDVGRSATRAALEAALGQMKAPLILGPTDGSPPAPQYLYLALGRERVLIEDHFGIWRSDAMVAEVEVVELLRDGRARCLILHSSVADLGQPDDVARPLVPTIPVTTNPAK
jgi:hypothetical protein